MYRYIKRGMDVIGAILMLIVCSIPMSVIAIVLRLTQSQVIFKQQRVGENDRLFLIYKFQTMTMATDPMGELLPDADRITPMGAYIRKLSLDELPQVFNILKGEMSFIGPRPLLVSYLPLYSRKERQRHVVKPGITGLAQVNGRNAISWSEKFSWDLKYVEQRSFTTDFAIFFLTLKKVVRREDVAQSGQATTLPFEGHH